LGNTVDLKPRGARQLFGTLAAPVLVTIITLVALAMRLQNLGVQSLWVDEAMSVVFSSKPLPELMQLLVTEDIHPPLYPVFLHYWMNLAGNSEYAARLPSAIMGALLIPLIYLVGRRLESLADPEARPAVSRVGLVAAVLAASSAFYIGYSQEARNYMAVTLAGLLSSYLLLLALAGRSRRLWIAYGIATLAALYTHYTAALLLLSQAGFVLLVRKPYGDAWKRWILATLAVGVGFLPWLGFSIAQIQRISDYWPGTLRLDAAIRTSLLQFVVGGGSGLQGLLLPAVLGIGLLFFGVLALVLGSSRRNFSQPAFFLLLYMLVPAALIFGVAYFRPKFDPRYLLVITPAFYLTLAWGIAAMLRPATQPERNILLRVLLPILGIAALTGTVAVSTVYGEPTKVMHVGDGSGASSEYGDYRALVSYLESKAEPGDAVVLMMNTYHPYVYYGKKDIPWYPLEPFDDTDGAIILLNRISEQHKRLWFILWQKDWVDPADYVMHVMDTQSREVGLDESFGGLGLRLFQLIPGQPFSYYPKVDHKQEALFGDSRLEFWGWNASADSAAGGDSIQYDLHWRPNNKIAADYKMVLSLVDADRHVWARTDEIMATALYPSSRWRVQEIVHDRHKLAVPPGTPPGSYQVELRLYDPATMKEIPAARWSGAGLGTSINLGSVSVKPTPENAFPAAGQSPMASWDLAAGDRMELIGAQMDRVSAKAGEPVEVTLHWRAPRQPLAAYIVRLALLDEKGNPTGEQLLPLVQGYPAYRWRSGEGVISKHWYTLPVDQPSGKYGLAAAVLPLDDRDRTPIRYAQVGSLEVPVTKAVFQLPAMQNRLGAKLGDKIVLAGFDLKDSRVRPGDALQLTLYWQALAPSDQSYKVFNHVIDDNNVFAGQRDAIPVSDTRPTTTWRKDEVVVDRYDIPIAKDAKPGSYSLKVGMYQQDGGQRLTITGPQGAQIGDSATLATVEVAP
jgi:mannosyltransferase